MIFIVYMLWACPVIKFLERSKPYSGLKKYGILKAPFANVRVKLGLSQSKVYVFGVQKSPLSLLLKFRMY